MKNEIFEEKIWNEIVVDCNDEYDQKMSWCYYLRDELEFPFIAYMPLKTIEDLGGKLSKRINVIGISTDDSNLDEHKDIMIEAEFDEYIMEFALSKIINIRASNSVKDAIGLWRYWIRK